jgi:uncharacterized protein YbbK (DUF523 family)
MNLVSLGLAESDLFQQALASLLREKKRQVLQHRLDILARYDAASFTDLESRIARGVVVEHPAWEDLIVAENLTARLEELDQLTETDVKPIYLVSACLLGIPCAYDGGAHPQSELIALAARGLVVPICPEVAGGLPAPRPPAEIVGGDGDDVLDGQARVVTVEGEDVTAAYLRGAECALATARRHGITTAILKQRSPSCGSACIYDGTHSGYLVTGQGVTAALLRRHGVTVWSEETPITHP